MTEDEITLQTKAMLSDWVYETMHYVAKIDGFLCTVWDDGGFWVRSASGGFDGASIASWHVGRGKQGSLYAAKIASVKAIIEIMGSDNGRYC